MECRTTRHSSNGPKLREFELRRTRKRVSIWFPTASALHSDLRPKYGFAELTHSGIGYYADCDKPCFNTDGSRIKRIEGALGTGDGLIRGLQAFGLGVESSQRWLLFGFGKIGSGVGMRLRAAGVPVEVVEAVAVRGRLEDTPVGDLPFVDMEDPDAVVAAVRRATLS
ncbi:MAG: hypothetical protein ACLR8Y_16520 [Alistipes indistinctus]